GPRERRSASRVTWASVKTSISRTIPSPPAWRPAPPLLERKEYCRRRTGYAYSRASAGVFRELVMWVWTPETPSLLGRAPMPPAMVSLDSFRLPGDVSASKRYWKEDIIEPEVEVRADGMIVVSDTPGTGYKVREDLVRKFTVREETFRAGK